MSWCKCAHRKDIDQGITYCKFNCVIDMLKMTDVAELFQKAGIIVLQFDPRSTDISEGTRGMRSILQSKVEDLSDALTFLDTQPEVDHSKLGLWGFSFGGTVFFCAAALDKRAKFIIAVCPLSDLKFEPGKQTRVLSHAIRDRESQILGNDPLSTLL